MCAQVVQRTNSGSHYGHMPIMPLPQVGAPSWPCGIVRCVLCACMRPGDMPCRPCRRLRVPPARLSRFYDCRDAIRLAHEMPRLQRLRRSAAVIVEGAID